MKTAIWFHDIHFVVRTEADDDLRNAATETEMTLTQAIHDYGVTLVKRELMNSFGDSVAIVQRQCPECCAIMARRSCKGGAWSCPNHQYNG
jgi:hypothetical protein